MRFLLLPAMVFALGAQTAPDSGLDRPNVGAAWKRNAEALKTYTYKRRTEITVKGKTPGARLDLIRYVDGEMQAIPLEAPARSAPQPHSRGLGGKIVEKKVEKKKDEMRQELERMSGLVQRFSPGSDAMKAALALATVSRNGSGSGDIEVLAKGVVRPTDSFMLVWSAANRRPVKIEIHSDLDGKPVTILTEYASLPEGPFYAARTVMSAPKKDLRVTIDTFEYSSSAAR